MGPKADDVFQSFRLSKEDGAGKKYKTVKDKFDDYFTFRWNTLYMNVESYKMNVIRDRIVISIQHAQLSKRCK